MRDEFGDTSADRQERIANTNAMGEVNDMLDEQEKPGRLDIECLGDVEPKEVLWLWRDRFPLSMLSVISGDPGVGKTTLLCDMSARISVGRPWPDRRDEENPAGDVVLLLGEDGIADTVRPRIDAAGGDPSRIHILNGVRHPESPDVVDPFALDRDLHVLDEFLRAHDAVRMIGVDPLDIFLGVDVDTHRKSDVQRSLAGLSRLAGRHGLAVVGALHLRKSTMTERAIYRTMGSLGFVSAPRSVWAVSRDQADRDRRLMTCVKLSIAKDPSGLAYTIEDPGVILWQADAVNVTADDALNPGRTANTTTARDDAADWLLELLGPGRMESDAIKSAASKAGMSWRTIQRAKAAVGVKVRRHAGGSWYWELNGLQDACH